MNSLQTNYQALPDENEGPSDSFVVHVASEGGKSRWNHVVDLDTFFRNIYIFHQKNGLACILAEEALWMVLFILISFGVLFCAHCVHFNFDEMLPPFANRTDTSDLSTLFVPLSVCAASFGVWSWLLISISVVVIVVKMYKIVTKFFSYKEIQQFFESAMKIPTGEIHNVTWHEVQCKLREVQHEQQMCVHKSDLTELDIYHRILRYQNYMVAMVNKNVLPFKYNVKFFGEWVYLSSALQYCIQLLLFESPVSPFQGTGTLKEEYKKYARRNEAAAELSRYIYIFGIINFCAVPFIFMWRLFSYFFAYSALLRYEPSFISIRKWSAYSRLYLRHFNELDHELSARLSRAYKPALEYMKAFPSPLFITICKFLRQIIGFVVVFFATWSLFKERLLLFDYVLMIITCGTLVFTALSAVIPDENDVYFPNQLMQQIVSEIHYVPDHFKNLAHTTAVRDEFSHLYQYNLVYLIEELFSALVTPYILIFHLRPRALDIVDFLRNFTVEVAGVGDVCSFALMDVSRHGNQHWLGPTLTKADQYQQAEDGKTELSLIHFTLMNPQWEPPPASNIFIQGFKEQVHIAKDQMRDNPYRDNPFYNSLNSLSTMGSKYASLVDSIHQSMHQGQPMSGSFVARNATKQKFLMKGGISQVEGPPYVQGSIIASITGDDKETSSLQYNLNPMEIRAADMSLSALFLHDVHDKHVENSRSESSPRSHSVPPMPESDDRDEESPLLDMPRSNYVQ